MSNKVTYKGLGAYVGGVKLLSTAGETLTLDDQEKLLIIPAGLNGKTYIMPSPDEVGITFEFALEGDDDTNENIIRGSSGDYDIKIADTTARGVSSPSTAAGNDYVKFVSITPTRYLQLGGAARWVAVSS